MDALVVAALEKVDKNVQLVLKEQWTSSMEKHQQVAKTIKSVDALMSALKAID